MLRCAQHDMTLGCLKVSASLTSDGAYYRIRLGDYRIGLVVNEQTVVFVRFLHRREIYRYFP